MPDIRVIKPTFMDLRDINVFDWPIESVGVSKFCARYPTQEMCYVLDGRVVVTSGEQRVIFGAGDLAIFPSGAQCTWQVLKPVRAHFHEESFAGEAA